ncbi:DUF3426 domain-containing protein [Luteimonas suaedae]|uniref:DUF3426 domain-containing protein n=1 Tax=Luteimonas suaedae TaxID=2605430 RepID=UPI0011F0141D|nr:DUF3426 domain-containing protein [Luteimonas suaedae]
MFINCPNCAALVATDFATDLPPERCPRCGFALREAVAPPAAASPAPVEPPTQVAPPAPPPAAADTPAPPAVPPPPPSSAPPPPAPARSPAATAQPVPTAATVPADRGDDANTSTDDPNAAAGGNGAPAAEARPPADTAAAAANTAASAEAPATQASEQESPDTPATPAPTAGDATRQVKPAPSFAQRHLRAAAGTKALRRRWPAVAAVVALALLLVLQLLLADRARLAADPQWRPLLAAVCGTIGCTLPPWREPESIALLQRDVRPHAELAGVLRVNATIRNDARWTQAWPHLVLRLSDIDGRTLGQRRFSPEEYLQQPPAPAGMSSGQRATIRLDVLEPSPHTVAFNFDFE